MPKPYSARWPAKDDQALQVSPFSRVYWGIGAFLALRGPCGRHRCAGHQPLGSGCSCGSGLIVEGYAVGRAGSGT